MFKMKLKTAPAYDNPENPTFTPFQSAKTNPPPMETAMMPVEPQSQSPDLGQSDPSIRSSADYSANEPEHIKTLFEAAPETPAGLPQEGGPALLTRDQFIRAYCTGFNVASAVTKLQTLAVSDVDPKVTEGFGALYDTCADIPALQFMLRPGGKWLGRAMAIGALFVPMSLGVAEELKLRRAAVQKADFAKARAAKAAPEKTEAPVVKPNWKPLDQPDGFSDGMTKDQRAMLGAV